MGIELKASQVYTDFEGFAGLRAKAREGSPEALEVAAKQFEAHLVQQLLHTAREANPEGGLFDGEGSGLYQDMFDKQMALAVTAGRGLGVADLLVRQLGDRVGQAPAQTAAPQAIRGAEAGADPTSATVPAVVVPAPASSAAATGGVLALDEPAAVVLPEAGTGSLLADARAAPALVPLAEGEALPLVAPVGGALIDQETTRAIVSFVGTLAAALPEDVGTLSSGPTPVRFANAEAFVAAVMPHARRVGAELGVDPRLLVAQAALETGWGRSIIRNPDGSSSHNLFNIKAHRSWDGPVAAVRTKEYLGGAETMVAAEFRSYDSFAASFRDYVDFLRSNPRYRTALTQTQDPEAFARSLQAAGYATDPSYADKIMRIYRTDRLANAVA